MDSTDLIASFATNVTYQVTRRARAVRTRGRSNPGPTSTISVVGALQPATGRDLLRLPEGRRSIETRVFFTSTELFTGDQANPNEADQLAAEGRTWEVQHVESWRQVPTDPSYYRCIVQAAAAG